jgi:carbon storage regulator CsrA
VGRAENAAVARDDDSRSSPETKEGKTMLVLTRKLQQEIVIADNIRVTILEIRGNRIKLGVTAPEHIEIQRTEGSRGGRAVSCVALAAED